MPIFKLTDTELYYEQYGNGETLLLIAGMGVDHSVWFSIAGQLASNYQIVLIDNRGVGRSKTSAQHYRIEQMGDDIIKLCQHLSLNKFHAIGNSMGGAILQYLCHQYPDYIHSAVISNAAMKFDDKFLLAAEGLAQLNRKDEQVAIAKINLAWTFSSQYLRQEKIIDALIKRQLNYPYPTSHQSYRQQLSALTAFDSRPYIKNIDIPCLVIGGDQDLICSQQQTRALADHLKQAQYSCFNNCGHLPHIEYPQQFIQHIHHFHRHL